MLSIDHDQGAFDLRVRPRSATPSPATEAPASELRPRLLAIVLRVPLQDGDARQLHRAKLSHPGTVGVHHHEGAQHLVQSPISAIHLITSTPWSRKRRIACSARSAGSTTSIPVENGRQFRNQRRTAPISATSGLLTTAMRTRRLLSAPPVSGTSRSRLPARCGDSLARRSNPATVPRRNRPPALSSPIVQWSIHASRRRPRTFVPTSLSTTTRRTIAHGSSKCSIASIQINLADKQQTAPGHYTASAVVTCPARTHALIHHPAFGIWIQPRGHTDPHDLLSQAAARGSPKRPVSVRPMLARSV